jgi:uncharacterized membrane protein (DUF441 family)
MVAVISGSILIGVSLLAVAQTYRARDVRFWISAVGLAWGIVLVAIFA